MFNHIYSWFFKDSTKMNSMNYINKIQSQLQSAFKSQDPELFDVVFDIEGKKLYANKLSLSNISSAFKSMLSDRWISKNDSIKIENYKFADFKELLTFIYSGECNLSNENVFRILNMSEFYQIKDLSELCEEYLSKTELNLTNIFQLPETSSKYSVIQTKKPFHDFDTQKFVVKITNSNGQAIFGDLSGKQNYEIELIRSLNDRESDNEFLFYIYWDTCCKIPDTPSPLKKRDGVEWYLIYDKYEGRIGLTRRCHIEHGDYLIAEMFSKTGFTVTTKCKIEIE